MTLTRSSTTLPRLLYVEDEPDAAAMVVEVLADHYLIDHVRSGEEGVDRALQRRYDLMLVDRRLPGLSGVELVERIRTARLTTPILMLTALGAVDDRVTGLDAGADDYLLKPFDFAELLARLRALQRGTRAVGDRREIGEWVFLPSALVIYGPTGSRVALTATETAVLELLSSSPDHVFSREEILDAVAPDGSPGTVDAYVHYLRRKIAPDIVETVRAHGYRLGEPW